jgi:RNA polymerase sigma-70 factor (ECF subfamily)
MVVLQDDQDFITLADPYRPELLAHCYRMTGSVHEAEDLVQETYLRAWQAYDRFEGRSSLRTWLYRIATGACLVSLRRRSRRPLPTSLGGPTDDPAGDLMRGSDVPWLEPVPDAMVGTAPDELGEGATLRESIRLTLIAALQHLPPGQRVVLLLRDILKWRAAEVADLLSTTSTAVNNILRRARAQLEHMAPNPDEVSQPGVAEQRDLLRRYARAFEDFDMAALVVLLREDAVWEMPPFFTWVRGAEEIGRLISVHCPEVGPGDLRMLPTEANGQPGFGMYLRDRDDNVYRPFGMHVVDAVGGVVRHVAVFFDSGLFGWFGLPGKLPAVG